MADTYTPLLRLTKPGLTTAGWGTLVNNGTFELIDNSIAGIVDVDVSAGNVTLTTASGASDQARYMCLRVINGPVSARNVIVPTLNKIYFVINEGAGPIQIKTATGAAVILLAGERTVVRVDAVSANVEIAIDRLQSLNLSFALAATSGGTGQSSYAVGDLLYASSTTAISKLTVGATNAVLTVAAGIPSWTPTLSAVSGGTGQSSFAVGDLLYANTTTTLAKLADVATGNVLRSGGVGVAPAWGKADLTTDVTGTLPVANGGTGQTTASAAFDALKQAATDSYTGVVELATTAEVQTGTDTTRAVTPATLRAGSLVQGTVQNSTSGTSIDFTGIPSWVKRITVMFNGVSTNGTSSLQVQLGDSGGIETTGYVSSSQGTVFSTTGLIFTPGAVAVNNYSGAMTLTLMTGNTWTATSLLTRDDAATFYGAGVKALSATLDRLRITTFLGVDTFDAGQINILYE